MTVGHDAYAINYISAPCGSGKTYSTCQYIKRHRYKANHLYVAPTQALIDETATTLRNFDVKPTVITSVTHPNNVQREIIEFLNSCESRGHVLLITWAAYIDLRYFNRRDNWSIFIDEVPQVDRFYSIDLHQNPEHLKDHVQVGNLINDSILPVRASSESRIEKLLETPDDITKQLREFYKDLINPHKDVFVSLSPWNKFAVGEISKSRDSNQVHFLSMLNPTGFIGCTILGANIEQSLLFNWFTQYHDIEFVPHQAILENLRFASHHTNTGDRLKITYLLNDCGHSKYGMNQPVEGQNCSKGEMIDRDVIKHFGGNPFLYAANNDYNGELQNTPNATRIETISHGLNRYDKEVNIYFGPALNRQPKHQCMLNSLGFANHTIKTATLHETAYQALMRTALRDPDSEAIVHCIVPEYETAARLVEIFSGAEIRFVENNGYQKVKPLTPVQRNQRSKFAKRKNALLKLNDDNKELFCECVPLPEYTFIPRNDDISLKGIIEMCHLLGADQVFPDDLILEFKHLSVANGGAASSLLITFHSAVRDRSAEDFLPSAYNVQDFIQALRETARTIIKSKDELFLFNPTFFNNTDPGGHRRLSNFDSSSMMVLDFDGGDLSIEDFIRVFWPESGDGRRSFVICNTFSRSAAEPNRFRVLMFYKHPVLSVDVHHAIYDSIVTRLEDHGFPEGCSGLDRACRNGVQSFYVPCINQLHPEQAFFETYGTTTRDLLRYAIDPTLTARTAIKPVEKVTLVDVHAGSIIFDGGLNHEDHIERIKSHVRLMPEGRHSAFFNVGLKLRSMGLADNEIRNHLEELEADIGKKRFNWAGDAMKSLKTQSSSGRHQ